MKGPVASSAWSVVIDRCRYTRQSRRDLDGVGCGREIGRNVNALCPRPNRDAISPRNHADSIGAAFVCERAPAARCTGIVLGRHVAFQRDGHARDGLAPIVNDASRNHTASPQPDHQSAEGLGGVDLDVRENAGGIRQGEAAWRVTIRECLDDRATRRNASHCKLTVGVSSALCHGTRL